MSANAEQRGNWREFENSGQGPILEAAILCIIENGYHGATIRQVAHAAGLSVAGVYHHFDSKQALLVELARRAMEELWWRSRAALADGEQTILARFSRLVECLLLFHAYRPEFAFIAMSEIRSMEPAARANHIAARDRQQELLDELVIEGAAAGVFRAPYPRDTSRAIHTVCTGVSQWFSSGGELSPEQLADRYLGVCLMTVGVDEAGSRALR